MLQGESSKRLAPPRNTKDRKHLQLIQTTDVTQRPSTWHSRTGSPGVKTQDTNQHSCCARLQHSNHPLPIRNWVITTSSQSTQPTAKYRRTEPHNTTDTTRLSGDKVGFSVSLFSNYFVCLYCVVEYQGTNAQGNESASRQIFNEPVRCHTEKSPNAWHLRGTQKTGNTYNQPNSFVTTTQSTVNRLCGVSVDRTDQAASCGWHVRCVGVRGDAWSVMLSPCNTDQAPSTIEKGSPGDA